MAQEMFAKKTNYLIQVYHLQTPRIFCWSTWSRELPSYWDLEATFFRGKIRMCSCILRTISRDEKECSVTLWYTRKGDERIECKNDLQGCFLSRNSFRKGHQSWSRTVLWTKPCANCKLFLCVCVHVCIRMYMLVIFNLFFFMLMFVFFVFFCCCFCFIWFH